jgi:amino acid adenylation domain-containing protein
MLIDDEAIDVAQTEANPRRQNAAAAPLSFAQQRLWFLQQLHPDSPVYNVPQAIRLTGPLNIAVLQQSLNEIVRRHEILRTTFPLTNGEPRQAITPPRVVELPHVDLRHLPPQEREAETRRLIATESHRPFDLTRGPLLRASLFQLATDDFVLLLNLHHIITDEWSDALLWREVSALYPAFLSGEPSPLADLPLQYADFAVWQHDRLQAGALQSQLDYWRRQLGSDLPPLHLPLDHPRPREQSFRGRTQRLLLPQRLTDSLKALARAEDATLFIILLAAFKSLLARYSGQTDIVVGSPIANRGRVELENLIGFFLNTLVLRTDLSGQPAFRQVLRRVRRVTLDAFAHQDLPFEHLVEALQPERRLSHNPLFQVMFVLNSASGPMPNLVGLQLSPFNFELETSHFDLTLYMQETEYGLQARLAYNTDLFNAATISRMLGHFRTLLDGIAANPGARLADLPLLTATERRQLLDDWTNTRTDFPRADLCHRLFETQASQSPAALAIIFENEALTYRELNRRANQLAHHLIGLGIGPDKLVAICLDRSVEAMVAVLAVLKAGGAYVPLDPGYPPARLAFMLTDSRAAVLLTRQHLRSRLPADTPHIICLDADWPAINRAAANNPSTRIDGENLAYVIYTSGSTGQPKGVAMPHRALTNLIEWQLQNSRAGIGSRTLHFASLSFDVSFQELFATWISGGTLVLVCEETRRDPAELLRYLIEHRVERLFLPFIALQHLAEAASRRSLIPANLREVMTAGEQLQITPQIAALFAALPDCTLHNQYGPTETHVATAFSLGGPVAEWPALPPIGRPIANAKTYILDKQLQPVPVGVPGELYLGGDCLARGYLHRPQLTAGRFIAHPFGNGRLYQTGDRARYWPGGDIEFLGRVDEQVKIRGYRVEPGEVETVLGQHPAVQKNIIVAHGNGNHRRLVAYVVPVAGVPSLPAGELRRFLLERLPDYLVPASFINLDTIPTTPSGKIARQELPPPQPTRPAPDEACIAPQTDTETRLVEIWEALLDVRPIGITDDFFEQGGHSLLAVKLFSRIEETFGVNLPLATLFQDATIEHLANVIGGTAGRQTWNSLVEIQPHGSRPPFFCVHGGTGDVLWFRELSKHLGAQQPFYGLQSRGLDGLQPPLTRVEEMAARYLSEMRKIQPGGPYFLGGYCFGGSVAFEMAQQLVAAGEEVRLLAIVSSTPPNIGVDNHIRFWKPGHIQNFLSSVPHWATNLWEIGPQQAIARFERRLKFYQKSWTGGQPQYTAAEIIENAKRLPVHRQQVIEANNKAAQVYIPRPYPGHIFVFEPRTPPMFYQHHTNSSAWDKLAARGTTLKIVPGSHQSVFKEPRVQILADELRKAIDATLHNGLP